MLSNSSLQSRGARPREVAIGIFLRLCASLSIVTTVGIIGVLVVEAVQFFGDVSLLDFLTGTEWTPFFEPAKFGVLPLLLGTLMIGVTAALVALPLGLGGALFLSEYASPRTRAILKPVLEVLAGIPTVVYGYFALTTVTPFLMDIIPATRVFNALSGGIVVGIMVLPMVASLCDDAMRAVPQTLRQGGYALGATQLEVSTRVVVPSALSGILAAFVLAISRAIGETMIVTLAAGATPNLTLNPLESIQTMTAFIAQVSLGDTPAGTVEYRSIFAVGLLLFLFTLAMNWVAQRILRRYREVYD